MIELSKYWSRDKTREATVNKNAKGYYVVMSENGNIKKTVELYEHSEYYAEDAAENWVERIIQ